MQLLLPYFIIFIVVLQLVLKKNSKKDEEKTRQFWEREREANAVRKKDISNLNYIVIPNQLLPDKNLPDKNLTNKAVSDKKVSNQSLENTSDSLMNALTIPEVNNAYRFFASFSDKKMFNLNNCSNTDIKLEYGAANLTIMSEYDDNFIAMCKAAVKLANALDKNGMIEEAVPYLEFIVKSGTDITAAYSLLMDYYIKNNNSKGIEQLKLYANSLNSLTKDIILKKLDL